MASKQQFLPEKLFHFNSALHSDSLIKCQTKHIVRQILRAIFALPSQHKGALQNYSILRPGYRSVRFLDTKCTFGIHKTYCHLICVEKNRLRWILCFKTHHHGNGCRIDNGLMLVLCKWPSWPHLLNITSETFCCNLTTLATLSWLNASNKQTSY